MNVIVLKKAKKLDTARRYMADKKNFQKKMVKTMTLFEVFQYVQQIGGGMTDTIRDHYYEVLPGDHSVYPLQSKPNHKYIYKEHKTIK